MAYIDVQLRRNMVPISELWLPILLSAVFVFFASFVLHMLLPFHRSDYRKLPEEERALDGLRAAGVTAGRAYHFPFCTHKEMKSPEAQAKFKRGPVGILTIFPSGPPAMGKYLGLWFVFCVIVSLFVAYLTGRALGAGASYREAFCLAAVVAFLGYGASQLQDSIWKGQTWGVTFKNLIDALIYALLTAGTFGWLWPK
jgi:hypothetical protein